MPVAAECECGASYRLKDESAGKKLHCPRCDGPLVAPRLHEVPSHIRRAGATFDRYVLDLAGDTDRLLDRRTAVALGVMLDAGERR